MKMHKPEVYPHKKINHKLLECNCVDAKGGKYIHQQTNKYKYVEFEILNSDCRGDHYSIHFINPPRVAMC